MTSRMRPTVRRVAAGAGMLALALGTMACTGGEDEQTAPGPQTPSVQEQPAQDDPSSAPDEEGDETAEPFSEDELERAAERFVEALALLEDRDWAGTCAMVLDPSTGKAPEGERLSDCVEDVRPAVSGYADGLEPGALDAIEPSMVEAVDEGDGSVSLSIMDQPVDVPMVPGDDGRWYFSIPF